MKRTKTFLFIILLFIIACEKIDDDDAINFNNNKTQELNSANHHGCNAYDYERAFTH